MGGAKLSWGLSRVADPARLTVISNTGDDETFYGLHVSPDLDTQMYTLAGLVDQERGWGLAGETFHGIEMFRRYGDCFPAEAVTITPSGRRARRCRASRGLRWRSLTACERWPPRSRRRGDSDALAARPQPHWLNT